MDQLINQESSSGFYECSECGAKFYVLNISLYKYKVGSHKQCCYTCYDHALLRLTPSKSLSYENRRKYVKRSEEAMKGQGKTILHPIKLNE